MESMTQVVKEPKHPLDNLNRQGRRMLAKRLRKQGMPKETIDAILNAIKENGIEKDIQEREELQKKRIEMLK